MARIASFEKVTKDRAGRHSDVSCGYAVVESDGRPALLLETYGSSDRAMPGKTSQSLLIDEAAARQLQDLLRRLLNS